MMTDDGFEGWEMMPDDERWDRAEDKLQKIKVMYASIGPSGNPALVLTIIPLETRLAQGERTASLFAEIMELE